MLSLNKYFKKIVSYMPLYIQNSIKKIYYALQIHMHKFHPDEPECVFIEKLVNSDDWVLDIGSNIGQYTYILSNLVGKNGRVFAFEPVPETFEILCSNVFLFKHKNVTLFNVAASDVTSIKNMETPFLETGLKNYYLSHITNNNMELRVFCIPIDSIPLTETIRFIKIDVEGHELHVLKGMVNLLKKDRPVLVIETHSNDVVEYLQDLGYQKYKILNSPNIVFKYIKK